MKIQLDTTNKTIKLESDVKLKTLVKTLDKLLPNKEWKQFTLQTNTTISYWNSPIVIREQPYRLWYEQPWITYMNKTTAEYKTDDNALMENYSLKAGVYNVEM